MIKLWRKKTLAFLMAVVLLIGSSVTAYATEETNPVDDKDQTTVSEDMMAATSEDLVDNTEIIEEPVEGIDELVPITFSFNGVVSAEIMYSIPDPESPSNYKYSYTTVNLNSNSISLVPNRGFRVSKVVVDDVDKTEIKMKNDGHTYYFENGEYFVSGTNVSENANYEIISGKPLSTVTVSFDLEKVSQTVVTYTRPWDVDKTQTESKTVIINGGKPYLDDAVPGSDVKLAGILTKYDKECKSISYSGITRELNNDGSVTIPACDINKDITISFLLEGDSIPDTTWQNDYEYVTDSTKIHLLKYNGNASDIIVPKYAVIDGKTYDSVISIGTKGIWFDKKEIITSIVFEDGVQIEGTAGRLFWFLSNLKSLDIGNINIGSITDISSMFSGLNSLEALYISGLDTKNVSKMNGLFSGCSNLTSLDLRGLDTSKVTDMEGMFQGMSKLESLSLNGFNTSSVTNMSRMFMGCSSLSQLDLSGFNTANVTNMTSMFYVFNSNCALDLSNFNTEKVTDTAHMFDSCKASEINLSSFDMSGVTNDEQMFLKCTTPSIYSPKNVSRTVFLNGDYYDESNNVYSELPKNLVQSKHLTTTPQEISGETTWQNDYTYELNNTSKIITLKKYNGSSKSLVVSSKAIINGITYTTALAGGTAIWQPNGSPATSTIESLVITDGVIIPSDCSNMFLNLQNLTSLDISHFNTSSVTSMSRMFANLAQLESLNLSHFNTANVREMSGMFMSCKNLNNLDISNFDTGNVTDMKNMFLYDYALKELDLSGFNTAQVQNMSNMFEDCYNLTSLNLSSFDTGNVTKIDEMFKGCELLKKLDLGSFDLSNLTSGTGLFAASTYHSIGVEEIYAPKNLNIDISLPRMFYDEKGGRFNYIPIQRPKSILIKDTLYTINWNANGGTGETMNPSKVLKGLSVNVPDCTYTKDNYEFKNWNTEADGTGLSYASGNKISPKENMTLYAQWKLVGKKAITYDANGGTGQMQSVEVTPGSKYTVSACAYEYNGGTFIGWNSKADGTGTEYTVNTEITVNDDLILYAQWRVSPSSIIIDPASAELDINDEITITARVVPDEAYDKDIIWSSLSSEIATVSGGVIKAIKAGETDIKATSKVDGSFFSTCKVKVKEPDILDYANINNETGVIEFDTQKGPYYEIDYINKSLLLCSDPNGKLLNSEISGETLTVTVTSDEYPGVHSYVFDLTQSYDIITTQEINTDQGTVTFDTTKGPLFIIDYLNKTLTYCSDPKGSLINSSITGNTLTVTVMSEEYPGEHSYEFDLGSSWQKKLVSISIPSTAEIKVGASTTLTVTYNPENATNKNVSWRVSDNNIATVNNGVVTGVSVGSTIVTAKSEDGNHESSCTVTVTQGADPTPPAPTPTPEPGVTTYTVVFRDGDTVVDTQQVQDGQIVKIPSQTPSKEGFSFLGWANGNTLWNFNQAIHFNVTLTAKYISTSPEAVSKNSGSGIDPVPEIQNDTIYLVKGQAYTAGGTGWSLSEGTGIAKVAAKTGKISAQKKGKAVVTNGTQKFTVIVAEPAFESAAKKIPLLVGTTDSVKDKFKINSPDTGSDSKYPITWFSANPRIAVVNDGVITGVAKGNTNIYACVGGKQYTSKVTVTDTYKVPAKQTEREISFNMNPLQTITLKYDTNVFKVNGAQWSGDGLEPTYNSKGKADGGFKNDKISITKAGKIKAIGKGSTTISGKDTQNREVKVTISVRTVSTKENTYITKGKSETVKFAFVKNNKAAWDSSDKSIISDFTNGRIKGGSVGNSRISCTYEGFDFNTLAYVEDPEFNTDSKLVKDGTKYTMTLKAGELYNRVTLKNVYQTVNFKSSKPAVAFIDENGVIYARSAGKTNITTSINGKTYKIVLKVE